MSAWLVSLSLMDLTVSYCHAWRRDLLSGLGLPFPRTMARRQCYLERDFDWLQGWPMPTQENQQIICCLCSPLFPRYQQMLISYQNRTGKRFIHLPSRLTSCCWRGTATRVKIFYMTCPRLTSCCWRGTAFFVQVLSPIYPRCAAVVARS